MRQESITHFLWSEIYFAATMGCEDCYEAGLHQIDALPVSAQGDAWAVAARGWWRLSQPHEAKRAWTKAQALGGPEVDALLPFLSPDGASLAAERARGVCDPGLRADAWCDVAGILLQDRTLPRARRAIEHALEDCPDHAEARRLLRALDVPDLAQVLHALFSARRSRRAPEGVLRELEQVVPTHRNGWVSPERFSRRHLRDEFGPAPAGSALARLVQAGTREFYLAPREDLARVPASHPLAAAELDIDLLLALLAEGRPALEHACTIWREALASEDRDRIEQVARLLCDVAVEQTSLASLAREACDWLLAEAGPDPERHAFRAWFAAILGEPDAAARARAVLVGLLEESLPWRLAVGALHRCGAEADGAAEIQRALRDPVRRDWAHGMTGRHAHPERVHLWVRARADRGLEREDW